MTDKPENPPAFPLNAANAGVEPCFGMSLRDYFAGQALVGYIVNIGANGHHAGSYIDECAIEAYAIADTMLAKRGCK